MEERESLIDMFTCPSQDTCFQESPLLEKETTDKLFFLSLIL